MRTFANGARFGAALMVVVACAPLRAHAQTVSLLPAGAGPAFDSPLALADGTKAVTDVFLGRNVVGPYVLSWRAIESGSDTVTRDGALLRRDADYRLDPQSGALSFMEPLRPRQIVRVDYRITPGKASANTSAVLAAPVQMNLLSYGQGSFTLSALVRPDVNTPAAAGAASPSGAMGSSGTMLLSFGGKAALARDSALTSQLWVDGRGGDILGRSGFSLGETSKLNVGNVTARYVRAGADYAGPADSGITAGRELVEATGSLNPIHGIAASASFSQTTDLPEKGRGAVVTALGQKLSGPLSATTRFQATRTETTTDTPDGDSSTRTATRVQVDQKIGPTTQATALLEQTETASKDGTAVAQTSTLNVRSTPDARITLTGMFQNRLLPSGAEDVTRLQVNATPGRQVKLTALLNERYAQSGVEHTREATVEYAPKQGLTLTGGFQVLAATGSEAMTGSFGATAKPLTNLEVSGAVKLRGATANGAPDPTAADTYAVNLTLGLLKSAVKLTGGYADNPDDAKGVVAHARSRSLGLQSTLGVFDFSGAWSVRDEYLLDRTSDTLDLRLGWRLARATQIVTTFKGTQTQEQTLLQTSTYGLNLTHRLGSLLDLSLGGAVTTYGTEGLPRQNPDYSAEARLGLRF